MLLGGQSPTGGEHKKGARFRGPLKWRRLSELLAAPKATHRVARGKPVKLRFTGVGSEPDRRRNERGPENPGL